MSEKMMHQRGNRGSAPTGSIQRNLVEVLDENVVSLRLQALAEISCGPELESVAAPDSMNVHSIEISAGCTAFPSAREHVYAISQGGYPAEYLVEVNFSASTVRVFSIVPVDDKNAH